MKNKIINKLNEMIEEIDNVWALIALFIVAVLCLAVGYALFGLICWGVVNGLLFLFGMPTTFTYLQGLVLGLVIKGIGIVLIPLKVKIKKEE